MTTVYTCPASTSAVVSNITICNRTTGALQFYVAIIPGGSAIDNKNYIYDNVTIPANDTFQDVAGFGMQATDIIQWMGSATGLSITISGVEIT